MPAPEAFTDAGDITVAGFRLRIYVREDGKRFVDAEDFSLFIAAVEFDSVELTQEHQDGIRRALMGEAVHG